MKVLVGERAITINRDEKVIHSNTGRTVYYDKLIMATGSYPWIRRLKARIARTASFTAPSET